MYRRITILTIAFFLLACSRATLQSLPTPAVSAVQSAGGAAGAGFARHRAARVCLPAGPWAAPGVCDRVVVLHRQPRRGRGPPLRLPADLLPDRAGAETGRARLGLRHLEYLYGAPGADECGESEVLR